MGNTQGNTQALAVQQFSDLRALLEKSKQQIASVLPKHLTPERMIRLALTTYQRTPDLKKCSLISIVGAVIQASELGLEINGILGHAYLVPYWNSKTGCLEAQFQAGWRGLVALARRSGEVSVLYPELVYEKDRYKIIKGDKPRLIHEPNYTVEDRGLLIGGYAAVTFKDHATDFEFMPMYELDRIRQSTKSKNKQGEIVGPWVSHPEEMFRKSPIRKLAKRLPMSAELQRAAIEDEFTDQGLLSGADYVDAASEMARAATEERTLAIQEKYAPSAQEGQAGEQTEEGDWQPQDHENPMAAPPQPPAQAPAQTQGYRDPEAQSQPTGKPSGQRSQKPQGVPLDFGKG